MFLKASDQNKWAFGLRTRRLADLRETPLSRPAGRRTCDSPLWCSRYRGKEAARERSAQRFIKGAFQDADSLVDDLE